MQSAFGGVSEIPQFMVDSCGTSLFAIPSSDSGPSAASATGASEWKYHILPYHHHMPQQLPLQRTATPLPPPHFLYSMPITQQLLQQPHHHQLQLFHQHHPQPPQLEPQSLIPHQTVALDQDSGPENSASPTPPIMGAGSGTAAAGAWGGVGGGVPFFLAAATNVKLGMHESSGGGNQEVINDDGGMQQGDDDGSKCRHHLWQGEDDSTIKEPPWRPLDIDYISRSNKRCNDEEPVAVAGKYCKKSKEMTESDEGHTTDGINYKLFSELEAICKPGESGDINQMGSGSGVTADQTPIMCYITTDGPGLSAEGNGVSASETSAGEEATVKKLSKSGCARRRRNRRLKQQLSSVAAFFESLVKRLMDHQESLHRRFLEVMEKRDQERTRRDEEWRKQEASKSSCEAAARARDRELASPREAAIVAFLEKITGESLDLPPDAQFRSDSAHKKDGDDSADLQKVTNMSPDHVFNIAADDSGNRLSFNASRWPKAEVETLIKVRSGLESRFQESGLKGPLWQEVSATMSAMGYDRSAKRCKEKWENINKYFRKTKEKGKKQLHQSKTCQYFQQLDQLYSRTPTKKPPSRPPPSAPIATVDNSELLDAIVLFTANEVNGRKLARNMEPLEHDLLDRDIDGTVKDELGGGGEDEEG